MHFIYLTAKVQESGIPENQSLELYIHSYRTLCQATLYLQLPEIKKPLSGFSFQSIDYYFFGSAAFFSQQEDFSPQLLVQSLFFVVSAFLVSVVLVLVSVLAALGSLSSTMVGTGLFETAAKEGAMDTPRKATSATSATIFFIIVNLVYFASNIVKLKFTGVKALLKKDKRVLFISTVQ
jgi:hypothetical protein